MLAAKQQTLSHLIGQLRRKSINPTHFLLVNFGYADISAREQGKVRRRFFELVNGKKFSLRLPNDDEDIHITWKSENLQTSVLYYATSRFGETYIHQMTKALVKSAYERILQELDLKSTQVQLNYLATKNMNYQVNLANGAQEAFGTVDHSEPATPRMDWEHFRLLPIEDEIEEEDETEERIVEVFEAEEQVAQVRL